MRANSNARKSVQAFNLFSLEWEERSWVIAKTKTTKNNAPSENNSLGVLLFAN